MAGPALAHLDEEGRRLYEWRGRGELEQFYSVTTLIGLGVPKYLVPWAAKLVAELAYDGVAEKVGSRRRGAGALRYWARQGRAFVEAQQAAGFLKTVRLARLSERELALRWLKGQPDRKRDEAAELGTEVHGAAEDYVLEHVRDSIDAYREGLPIPPWPDELAPHMHSFLEWLNDFRPRIEATEFTVFNRAEAYAGTGDLLAWLTLPGESEQLVLIDYKSGRAIYSEVALQLAAYARGEFIGSPDGVTEIPMPGVERAFCLHLTPKGYEFIPVQVGDEVFRAFLFAREIVRWRLDIAKTVLGEPLTPPPADAALAVEGVA